MQAKSGDFEMSLPASSANLGAAFDAAAIALGLRLRVRARAAGAMWLSAAGRDAEICGNPASHLILDVYGRVLAAAGRGAVPIELHLENEIPIGKGCGSSAAARLAGVALAAHFGELGWSGERILAAAAELEGHADNVAACWLGGLAVAQVAEDGAVRTARVECAAPWMGLLAVPDEPLATAAARAVVPAAYARGDAVANVQSALLMLAAFQSGRGELLRHGFADRFHQPYRSGLCPLLPALQPLAGEAGILGVALSGAGGSVLLVVDGAGAIGEATAAAQRRLEAAGLRAELIGVELGVAGASCRLLGTSCQLPVASCQLGP